MPAPVDTTLLTVFIGLVTLSLVGIAVSVCVVAWYAVQLIRELDSIARRLHQAGEVVAEDLNDLRLGAKSGARAFIYQISKTLWHKKRH